MCLSLELVVCVDDLLVLTFELGDRLSTLFVCFAFCLHCGNSFFEAGGCSFTARTLHDGLGTFACINSCISNCGLISTHWTLAVSGAEPNHDAVHAKRVTTRQRVGLFRLITKANGATGHLKVTAAAVIYKCCITTLFLFGETQRVGWFG